MLASSRTAMPWRGRSGAHYPVAHAELDAASVAASRNAILIAARRDDHGIAQPKAVCLSEAAGRDWAERARADGATELHVHMLDGSVSSADALDDLHPDGKRGKR